MRKMAQIPHAIHDFGRVEVTITRHYSSKSVIVDVECGELEIDMSISPSQARALAESLVAMADHCERWL